MAAATSIVTRPGARRQFQSLFSKVWAVRGILDPASEVDAAGTSHTFTMTAATGSTDINLGDMVLGFSASVSLAGVTVTAYVSAAGVITVRTQNESAGTVDLASATWRFVVARLDANLLA